LGSQPAEGATQKFDTTFAVMKANDPQDNRLPVEPNSMYGDQPFMLNFRTDDLGALLKHLEAKQVLILRQENTDYGRFAWVRDLDGNRVGSTSQCLSRHRAFLTQAR
jgi:hypothetical protein